MKHKREEAQPIRQKVTVKQVIKHAKFCRKLLRDGKPPLSLNEVLSGTAGYPVIADLSGLVFKKFSRLTKKPQIINLSLANLSGADLSGVDFSGVDFSGVNLVMANFNRANLSGANLSKADLSVAKLTEANLSGADLSGADFSWAHLSWAHLIGANLTRADLTGTNLGMVNLSGAYINGLHFDFALNISQIRGENAFIFKTKGLTSSQKAVLAEKNIVADGIGDIDLLHPIIQIRLQWEAGLANEAQRYVTNSVFRAIGRVMVDIGKIFGGYQKSKTKVIDYHLRQTIAKAYLIEKELNRAIPKLYNKEEIANFAVSELHQPQKDQSGKYVAKTPEFLKQLLIEQNPVNRDRALVRKSSSVSLEK